MTSLKSTSFQASCACSVDRMISMYFIVIAPSSRGPWCPPHSHVERARGRSAIAADFLSTCFHDRLALARYTLGGYAVGSFDERTDMTLAPEGRTELALSGGGCSCCAPPLHSVSAAEPAHGEAES